MNKNKFNELQFYIIFFVIFLLVSNLGTSKVLQQETATGMMPVGSMLIPAGIQLTLLFLIIWASKRGGNSLRDIGFRTYSWWMDCLIGLGVLAFLFYLIPWLEEFLVNVLHLPQVSVSKIPFSAAWVLSAIVIGITEEAIFRGYGYTILKKHLDHPWISLLIVSVMFGLEHLYQGPAGAVQTFMIALIANGIFIWRRSLIPIALPHAAINILMPFM